MATQNIINIGDSARCFTGVATWGGAGDYYDDTTLGSFTVSRPGTGFIRGKPVAWAGSQTVTGLTAGNLYYICIDTNGLIYKTTDDEEAYSGEYMPLFECLRDSTSPTNNQITVKEDHPYNMPYLANHFLHDSIGIIIENHSKGANITLNGTQKIQINGTDYLLDHGLTTTIPDSSGVAVTFNKMYTDGSGKWATYNTSDTFSGYWNSAGTPTALGASKYGVYTLYLSKDDLNSSTPTYYAVLDIAEYNNQTAAQTAIGSGSTAIATNELAGLELCKLGYIIFSQASTSIVQVIIAKSTFQSSVTTTGASAAGLITTSTTNFDGILSAANTNVQSSLETIDEWGKTTTDHAILIGNGTGSPIGSLAVGATGEMIIGNTGADPSWSSSPTVTGTMSADTFSTTTAANYLSINDNNITSNGSGSDIDINFVSKGIGGLTFDGIATGYSDSQWHLRQSELQTTNATPTALVTIALVEGEMITINATINGFQSDFTDACGSTCTMTCYRPTGGNVTQIGEEIININSTSTAVISADVNVGTQSLVIYATGVAAETWNWVSTHQYMFTKTNA